MHKTLIIIVGLAVLFWLGSTHIFTGGNVIRSIANVFSSGSSQDFSEKVD